MSAFVPVLRRLKGQHISEVIRALYNAFVYEIPFFIQISQLPCLFTVRQTGTSSGSILGLDLAVGLAPLEKKFCKGWLFFTLQRNQTNISAGAWSLVFLLPRGRRNHTENSALYGTCSYKNSPKELHQCFFKCLKRHLSDYSE